MVSSALAALDVVEWIIILTCSHIVGATQEVQGDNVFFNTALPHIMVVHHYENRCDVRQKLLPQLQFAYWAMCLFAELQVRKRSFFSARIELRSQQQSCALC